MSKNLTRTSAVMLIAILVLLVLWGILGGQTVRDTSERLEANESDINLYMTIAERVSGGENYYQAAISEQAERGYPVQPATAVRTPVTTLVITLLGEEFAYLFLLVLLASVFICSTFQFEKLSINRLEWIFALILLMLTAILFGPLAIYYQETWAVLLIILSICARSKNLLLSVALALVACAFRELALPFIAAMACYEFFKTRYKASLIWCGALVVYLVAYVFHIHAVSVAIEGLELSQTLSSPGWFSVGGWPFIVGSVRSVTVLSALPLWVSAVIIPLALFGWLMHKSPHALPYTFAILGFIIPFLLIGRPNNNYWGLLYAMMLLPGLAFSINGLKLISQSVFNTTK